MKWVMSPKPWLQEMSREQRDLEEGNADFSDLSSFFFFAVYAVLV